MLDALTIADSSGADVALLNPSRKLTMVSGLQGIATPREIVRPRSGQHGDINETSHVSGHVVTLEGKITGADESAVWAEFDALNGTLWEAIAADRTLKWTRKGVGTALQSSVRLSGAFDAPLRYEDAGVVLPFQVMLRREDPRGYAQSLTTVNGDALSQASGGLTFGFTIPFTFTPSGGGQAAVTNSGNIPTPPVFHIHGQTSSPEILLVGTENRIVFNGSVAEGSYLEVDVANRTVKLNGTTPRENLLDFATTKWFELPTGESTIRLLASSFNANARVDVLYRSAYA